MLFPSAWREGAEGRDLSWGAATPHPQGFQSPDSQMLLAPFLDGWSPVGRAQCCSHSVGSGNGISASSKDGANQADAAAPSTALPVLVLALRETG